VWNRTTTAKNPLTGKTEQADRFKEDESSASGLRGSHLDNPRDMGGVLCLTVARSDWQRRTNDLPAGEVRYESSV
jgi:hypothetical protein